MVLQLKKKSNSADLKYVFQVAKKLRKYIKKYKIVVTKSTVPVSTGDKIEKILNSKGRKKIVDVVSNPEFLREGEAIRDFIYPDRVVVGTNSKKANRIMNSLYLPIIKKKSRYFNTSRKGAELVKYASNAFLATKISYINEIANLCEKTNVNVEDVSIGMGLDERIGGRFLRPGPAYGGSCFPKDTKAITITGDFFNTDLSIIKSVIKSNEKRRLILTERIKKILSNKIKNKKIAFLGVTFKPNTDDMRQSSSLVMIPYLDKKGAIVSYYDPTGFKKEFSKFKKVKFCDSIKDTCNKADLVIIHTEWEEFKALDFMKLAKSKKFKIYDLRNLYSHNLMKKKGFKYYSIGR